MNHEDSEFLRSFEACEIPNAGFHHRDHIRLACLYVQRYGPGASERICESIRAFAAAHGKSDKYHQTVTIAWMELVQQAVRSSPPDARFEDIVARFPALLDKNHLGEFYSEQILISQMAKQIFVPPDRKPLVLAQMVSN